MKKLLCLVGCILFILVFVGCSERCGEIAKQTQLKDSCGDEEFPEFLVGVWKADRFNWAFKFEPDGTISKLEHILAGKINIEEGGNYIEGADKGTYAFFVMGPCEVEYDPNGRQLSVRIFLDEFYMEVPDGELKGRNEDYFSGPVSEDGKTWTVSWRDYSWLEGADPPDANLIEAYPEKLIFTKLEIK